MRDAEQIEAVVLILQELVGEDLVVLALTGSAVEGGLKPASDLDLLAVLRRPLTRRERQDLARRVRAVSGRRVGGRPLELTAVVRSEVEPWHYPPIGEFQYGDWLAEDVERGLVEGPAPMPGLAVELTQVLRSGRVLVGPPLGAVLTPVPHEDVLRSCRDAVPGLLVDLEGDERNVLLTLARIWCTLASGEIRAKDEAAQWTLPRIPADLRPVMAHARELYLDTAYADEWWPDELRRGVPTLVQHLVGVLGSDHERGATTRRPHR